MKNKWHNKKREIRRNELFNRKLMQIFEKPDTYRNKKKKYRMNRNKRNCWKASILTMRWLKIKLTSANCLRSKYNNEKIDRNSNNDNTMRQDKSLIRFKIALSITFSTPFSFIFVSSIIIIILKLNFICSKQTKNKRL